MSRRTRILLTVALAATVLVGGVWEFVPLTGAEARLAALPVEGPGFQSWPARLTPAERSALGPAHAVRRVYELAGAQLVVTVVDGAHNRHAVHHPDFCFRGAGWNVVARDTLPLAGGHACRLRVEKDGRREELVFWFSDGESRHASMFRYWRQTTLRRLTLGTSGPEPLMVTIQPISGGTVDWAKVLVACQGQLGL